MYSYFLNNTASRTTFKILNEKQKFYFPKTKEKIMESRKFRRPISISPEEFTPRQHTYGQLYEYRKCKICAGDAKQVCAKCPNTYYCSSECHLVDWKNHKFFCGLTKKF